MDFLFVLTEMHKGLIEKRERLTPLSSKSAHEDYLKSLKHYKKIFGRFSSRINEDLDKAIEKGAKNISIFELSG
jgi:hypothetical protein